jgi:hypothetical protein
MGQAKARGTREQRIAQAVYRHQQAEAHALQARKEAERREAERIAKLPPEIRKEVVMRRGKSHLNSILLAGVMASLAVPTERKK